MTTKIRKHKGWLTNTLTLVLILVLGGLVTKLYFSPQFPYTHDGENHLARFANYKVALKEGQFPPRFAPNLMNHYGYPVFNYNYPLANILSVPFSFLKLNYQLTFKILAATSLGFGLIGCWHWFRQLGIRRFQSIAAGLVSFATAPLVISLFYHRGNIGEILALAFLPWLFAELTLINQKKSRSPLAQTLQTLFSIFIWTCFFLSHNVTVLFGTTLLVTYFVGQKPSFSQLKTKLIPFILGIGLSLWFWLPAIGEKSLIILDNANLSVGFADHFVTINQLLFSPLSFGFSRIGRIDGLVVSAGFAGIVGLIISMLAICKSWLSAKSLRLPSNQLQIFLLTLLGFSCLFFQLPITEPVWQLVPFAQFIQFPWRLSLFFAVISSALLAFVIEKNTSKTMSLVIWFLLLVQLVAVIKHTPVDYFSKNIIDYDLFSQSTSTLNENLPKQFTYQSFSESWSPKPSTLNLDSKAQIEVLSWTGTKRHYKIATDETVTVVEPTMRFAGWETYIEQSADKQQLDYTDNNQIAGRIAYVLEPGSYTLRTEFTQNTPFRIAGNTVSLLSAVVAGGLLVWQFKKSK